MTHDKLMAIAASNLSMQFGIHNWFNMDLRTKHHLTMAYLNGYKLGEINGSNAVMNKFTKNIGEYLKNCTFTDSLKSKLKE